MRRNLSILSMLFLSLSSAQAQSSANLVAASYSAPAGFEVAPGQVVTLFFQGVKPLADGKLRSATADTAVLPTTLAGLSARITQLGADLPVPLFAVRQENQCGSQPVAAACVLTSVKVQIPFELALDPQPASGISPPAQITLVEDGQTGRPVRLQPVVANAHVLTSCDLVWDTNPESTCNRAAYHADGRIVSASAPAKAGETVSVFAYGLGPVWPAGVTGKPAPSAAQIEQSGVLRVWADIRKEPLNASPSAQKFFDAEAISKPGAAIQYAGVAPGQIGLYQINVLVPASFQPILTCGAEIRANASILVTTAQGSEVIPVCVAP